MNTDNNKRDEERPVFTDLYYSPTMHLPWLERCNSFEEVAEVAIDVLHHMHQLFPQKTFHQICGPITTGGLTVNQNLLRLEQTIVCQRELGRIVFNQLPTETRLGYLLKMWEQDTRNRGNYCFKLLEGFYQPIFESGLIHKLLFLPNWQSSIGARWEQVFGQKIGIPTEALF